MQMTIEQLKENVLEIIERCDCTIEDALTHPDIGEDLCRVVYTEEKSDFDTDIYYAIPEDEVIKRMEKISATVTEMLKAEGWE